MVSNNEDESCGLCFVATLYVCHSFNGVSQQSDDSSVDSSFEELIQLRLNFFCCSRCCLQEGYDSSLFSLFM